MLAEDVQRLRDNPFVAGRAEIGGFLYDVDSGGLTQLL